LPGILGIVVAAGCGDRSRLPAAGDQGSSSDRRAPGLERASDATAGTARGDEFSHVIVMPKQGDAAASAKALECSRQERQFGRHERASRALMEALRLDPANIDALRESGAIALDRASGFDPVQAVLAFRTLRLLLPDDVPARIGELSAAVALGDANVARRLAASIAADAKSGAIRLDPAGVAGLAAAEATIAILDGNPAAALAPALRAVEAAPTWRNLEVLARTHEEGGRVKEALAATRRALQQRPDDASLHFTATRLERRLGNAAAADRHQRAYLALFPFESDSSDTFRTNHRRRIELRREFLAASAGLPRARDLLTMALIEGGELVEAAESLEKTLKVRKDDLQSWYLLATVRAKQRDAAAARAAAEHLRGKVPPAVLAELTDRIEGSALAGE
jgi:tetratricopeptide (TPR) repeat protein